MVLAAQGPKGDSGPQGPLGPEATKPARTAHLIVIRHVDNSGIASLPIKSIVVTQDLRCNKNNPLP
ncbi:MAG: hypothetical protein JO297_10620 [Nitrososphaeraceae archaeon]|nr:hypothetical protein [Nitrososphaeraceae archaeon]